jgi:HEPN domain-containing protein
MSEEKLWTNARRWYRQAENDVDAADVLLSAEKYAQASFLAQQAAEKAMKAVWIAQDRDPWGPSIARLIQELPEQHHSQFDELRDAALYLDKLYIPTRYPDALADLIPSEAYTEGEAEQACRHAHELVSRVETWLNQHGPE